MSCFYEQNNTSSVYCYWCFHTYYSKGSSIIKFVPAPNWLVTRIEPLCNSTISFATASPIPFPPVARVLDLSTR